LSAQAVTRRSTGQSAVVDANRPTSRIVKHGARCGDGTQQRFVDGFTGEFCEILGSLTETPV